MSPTSSAWRMLCGAAVSYGLTDGSWNAGEIKLSSRGRAIVAPTDEGADKEALIAAVKAPTLMRAFIEKYDDAKFPQRNIGINVLEGLGLPRERCEAAFDLVEDNLKFLGALQATKNGFVVVLRMASSPSHGTSSARHTDDEAASEPDVTDHVASQSGPTHSQEVAPQQPQAVLNTNVFISHGKNRELVETLKKAVTYGKFKPIVSVEITDTSKPVPQKVLAEMRSCFGGIVHVRGEGAWTDADGKDHPKINDNVLIEIGAAMAMYKDNFILLVEKGTQLPTNLQGLFVCYYEGDKLDGDSTMRLLEGLSKFQPG